MLDKKIIRQHFEKASKSYDAAAVLQKEVAARLSARLEYIKHQPERILDVGSGTGFLVRDMLKRYPEAQTVALDLALNMSRAVAHTATVDRSKIVKKGGGWVHDLCSSLMPSARRRAHNLQAVCGDAECLPFKQESFDLLVSSLMLQWSNDLASTLAGFHHVLAPNGLLLFTTFGPDTLREIRQSWAQVDNMPHTSTFADMHEIGDMLLQAGFLDPVTDMEIITMTYANVRQLMRDIKNIGASNSDSQRCKGLTGKDRFAAFEQAYEQFKTSEGLYPASWEVIYGHAWVGEGVKRRGTMTDAMPNTMPDSMSDKTRIIPIKEIK